MAHLNVLPDIIPDSRLLKWNEKDLAAIIAETELFVAEILQENHPIETFIDPSFTYLNKRNAKLYNIKFPNSDTMARVDIKPGGRHGGILGQASVMMATANGWIPNRFYAESGCWKMYWVIRSRTSPEVPRLSLTPAEPNPSATFCKSTMQIQVVRLSKRSTHRDLP